jgi:hypothetical protein
MDFVARSHQSDGAFVVALEGGAVSVVHVAVRFNHNPLDRPEEIDEMRADEDIDLGKRDFRLPTQGQEIHLQRRACIDRSRIHIHRNATQPGNTIPTATARYQPLKLRPVHPATSISGNKRALELLRIETPCHIEQRSLDRRDRYALLDSHVMAGKRARLVHTDLPPISMDAT